MPMRANKRYGKNLYVENIDIYTLNNHKQKKLFARLKFISLDNVIAHKTLLHKNLWGYLGPILQTWINFNPGMDKYSYAIWSVWRNYFSNPQLKGSAAEIWEWNK